MNALLETISPNMEHSAVSMVGWLPVQLTTHHTTSKSTRTSPGNPLPFYGNYPQGFFNEKTPESTEKFSELSPTPQLKQRATHYFPGGDRHRVDCTVVNRVETKVFTLPSFTGKYYGRWFSKQGKIPRGRFR